MSTIKDFLVQTHCDNDGNMSWMRVGCSVLPLTGCSSILIQLLLAVVVCIINGNLSELSNIEWMQPVSLMGIALTGKVVQKQTETPAPETK